MKIILNYIDATENNKEGEQTPIPKILKFFTNALSQIIFVIVDRTSSNSYS